LRGDSVRTYALFTLPPVALEVINNASHPEELIPIAIQLRDKYERLRLWLGTYQSALNDEDTKEIIKHRRKLDSLAREVDATLGKSSAGSTNISLGVSWLKINWAGSPLDRLDSLFGVRAILSELAFGPQGEQGLRKLVDLFDEKSTKLGLDTYKELVLRYSCRDQ
jgi:hypothetical protein